MTEPAYKIKQSIAPNSGPMRVAETGYGIEKHREISAVAWHFGIHL